MNKIFLEVIRIISAIVAIIMMIITIVLIFIKIFGNSPTDITVIFSVAGFIMAFLIMIISILVGIKEDIGSLKSEVCGLREFKNQTINRMNEMENKVKRR